MCSASAVDSQKSSWKLTPRSAQPGPDYERWKALYEAAPEGKNNFAAVDFGSNTNLKIPLGSNLTTWVPAGTVTLGFGGDV